MSDKLMEIRNLHKSYQTPHGDVEVLKDISFTIRKGEIVAITGTSGVGKSTLLHLMGGLDRPTLGTILFNGKSIFNMSDRELAGFRNRAVGFVFQFHHLLPEFTALENVAMPLLMRKNHVRLRALDEAESILNEVGLSHRLKHLPAQLSGGEQQRVAIARSMVTSPALVLADEPTGNLDSTTGRLVFEVICNLNRKFHVTFVVASHDMELARSSHRCLKMLSGSVAEDKP
ncbi:ABC transporter ATP-binding protein [bacterium]|nr:ABC transporter ATP-binding protein [candidate division CSSED10-310 bacterium]